MVEGIQYNVPIIQQIQERIGNEIMNIDRNEERRRKIAEEEERRKKIEEELRLREIRIKTEEEEMRKKLEEENEILNRRRLQMEEEEEERKRKIREEEELLRQRQRQIEIEEEQSKKRIKEEEDLKQKEIQLELEKLEQKKKEEEERLKLIQIQKENEQISEDEKIINKPAANKFFKRKRKKDEDEKKINRSMIETKVPILPLKESRKPITKIIKKENIPPLNIPVSRQSEMDIVKSSIDYDKKIMEAKKKYSEFSQKGLQTQARNMFDQIKRLEGLKQNMFTKGIKMRDPHTERLGTKESIRKRSISKDFDKRRGFDK